MDLAFELVTKKSLRTYSIVWRFLVLAAVPMGVLGLVNLFFEKDGVASGLFDLASSAVFLLVGFWYYRLSRKDA